MAGRRRRRPCDLRATHDVRRRRQEVDLAEGQVDERRQSARDRDEGGGLPERKLLQVIGYELNSVRCLVAMSLYVRLVLVRLIPMT